MSACSTLAQDCTSIGWPYHSDLCNPLALTDLMAGPSTLHVVVLPIDTSLDNWMSQQPLDVNRVINIESIIDAILECVCTMRSFPRRMSVWQRNEIVSEIARINAHVAECRTHSNLTYFNLLYTELAINWEMMRNGSYNQWTHCVW